MQQSQPFRKNCKHNFFAQINNSHKTSLSILYILYIDLINSVKYIFEGFDSLSDIAKKDLLLYGDPGFDINKSKLILEATLFYIKSTERFSGSLFD